MAFLFVNNVNTTLASAVSSSQTTITLSSAAGLPSSIPSGDYLVVTLNDVATRQHFEVLYATAVSGATLTVLRAQEGTGALSWLTGDFVFSGPTAGQMAAMGQLAATQTWSGANTFSEQVTALSLAVTDNATVGGTLDTAGAVSFVTGSFSSFNATDSGGSPFLNFNSGVFIEGPAGGPLYLGGGNGAKACAVDINGNFTAPGNITTGNTVTGGYVTSTGNVNANGTVTGGAVSVTGNVNGNSGTVTDGARGSGTPTRVTNLADFSSSLASNGYGYLPDGRLEMWGVIGASGYDAIVIFPIAFPNACLNVQATNSGVAAPTGTPAVGPPSTTSVVIYGPNTGLAWWWRAIGY